MAFVSHGQVVEDRKLFASSRVGEPKLTGDDTQTAPTKVGIPPKLQAEVTVRPTLWFVLFFTAVRCSFSGAVVNSRVCDIVVWLKFCACPEKNVLHGSGAEL